MRLEPSFLVALGHSGPSLGIAGSRGLSRDPSPGSQGLGLFEARDPDGRLIVGFFFEGGRLCSKDWFY